MFCLPSPSSGALLRSPAFAARFAVKNVKEMKEFLKQNDTTNQLLYYEGI